MNVASRQLLVALHQGKGEFRRVHFSTLGCVALIWAAAMWTSPAQGACSRTIRLTYMAPLGAAIYQAAPEKGLPSLTDAIAAESGCKLEVRELPTQRALRDFADGTIDVVLVAIQSKDRDRSGEFLPAGESPWVLVTNASPADFPRRIEEFDQNRHWLLGMIRGAVYPDELQRAVDRMKTLGQIDESTDYNMALTKLANHRDAAVLMLKSAFAALGVAPGQTGFQAFPQTGLAESNVGTYLSRRSLAPQDREALRLGLQKVMASGLPDRLQQAHASQAAGSTYQPH